MNFLMNSTGDFIGALTFVSSIPPTQYLICLLVSKHTHIFVGKVGGLVFVSTPLTLTEEMRFGIVQRTLLGTGTIGPNAMNLKYHT